MRFRRHGGSLLLGAVLWCCTAPQAAAQALTVVVRDSAGNPLDRVGLVLLNGRGDVYASARTGANGTARLRSADSGTYTLIARRFGYRAERRPGLTINPADTTAVRITLERLALVLDPVQVTAQRDSVRRETNPFGINLRATGGHIITPAEIDLAILGARDFADVLVRRALPGMVVDQVQRCPRSNRGGGCLPFVVDGQLFYNGASINDVVLPEMIDYVVVLRGSEVGVRYGSVGHNGIILIATKRDWRRGH